MQTNTSAVFSAVLKTFKGNKLMVDKREDGIYIRLAGNESKGEIFSLEWWKIFSFEQKSNTHNHAQRELLILSKSATDPDNRPIIEPFIPEILALCEKFGKSGQSGGSAPYTATALSQAIKKLCLQEPICPVTGLDDEWMNVSGYGDGKNEKECVWQNNRCSGAFKNSDNRAWYLDAIIWKEENGNTYFGSALLRDGTPYHSKQFIKSFPFTPKTFYIDVVKKVMPEDWTKEPFVEWDYYDTKHFEETGEKIWKKEKYRNIIKSPIQLKKVFEYYDLKPW